MNQSSA